MFLEIILALILGVGTGIITGLVPGIHINLVSVTAVSLAPLLLSLVSPLAIGVYLISLAITHTFLDALPSIYLGAPDEAQALNALPGHRLLMRGEGHNAIAYTVIGALGALLLSIILFPGFIYSMKIIDPYIKGIMGYLLALIMIYMIAREKKKWLKSLTLFFLAGVLGLIVFNIPTLNQPLLPLLSGMFGFSLLLLSLNQNSKIPKQNEDKPLTLSKKNLIKSVSAASGMGFIAAFLPGFGSSQAAIVATNIVGDIGDEGFLTLVGGINTANMIISIATIYILDKARNGAIVAINQVVGKIGFQEMLLFIGVGLVAGGTGAILTLRISKVFSRWIVKVNYTKLIMVVLGFVTLLAFFFDGFLGLTILAVSTAIGIMASVWGVGKNHLMGCLILPVILYFVI
ncbi:MAG TPA: tripartite tricarboxylate transporter permease [Candidatus Nanoarchaeia archaeon]|nr:tripartite tricarboxylate transporter permease [Candidatus Nanoarchaeia archaeon]